MDGLQVVGIEPAQITTRHLQEEALVLARVALPYRGLFSPLPAAELVQQLRRLDAVAAAMGCVLDHPCMTLSFLSLSVIPSLKLTDQGLIDVETFTLLPLQR